MPTSFKTLSAADVYVRKTTGARWDNYTIVLHKPHPKAEFGKAGRFNRATGLWGYETRIDVNEKGHWVLPNRRP